MSRHRRILHPTDFSSASGAAFKRAIALAKADKAQLFIAHVIAPPMPIAGEGYMPPNLYEDLEASARKYTDKKLAALEVKARAAGVKATTLVLEGVAHEEIVRAARAINYLASGDPSCTIAPARMIRPIGRVPVCPAG